MILIGDVHWSEYSSIVRGQGERYSKRLENLIKSINWVNTLKGQKCQLGDFFDSATVRGNELTALKEVDVSGWKVLQGNHELDTRGTSTSALNCEIVGQVKVEQVNGVNICYLPYIHERDRKPLKEYFKDIKGRKIILSHNDIAGIRYGKYLSKQGFTIEEIEAECELFINGHLHNWGWVTDKIINIGNLTGQRLDENGQAHYVWRLDLEKTGKAALTQIENPYGIRFLSTKAYNDEELEKLKKDGEWAMSIETTETMKDRVQEFLNTLLAGRKTIKAEMKTEKVEIKHINHVDKFIESIIEKMGYNEILEEIR